MRKALRILLLVAGCAVMMATSDIEDMGRRSAFVTLGAGEAQTFMLEMHPTKSGPLRYRLHVRFPEEWKGGEGARVVGILSSRETGSLRLNPQDTFTVGQDLGDGARVAFVNQVPFETLSGDGSDEGWALPEGTFFYFTLYSPDRALLGELEVDLKSMEAKCKCDVYAGVKPVERSPLPGMPADGGDGG
ncbi:hypothetical protein [Stigmatella erecta]|uniref:Uncharacterized protein n=1 Tax=Stigmatella erecta TaxID=83460 RepID=A0A1I0JSH8_9BACT|nr:hypothetical protein [Stigmatella erecta]SEU13709.1 hypothetical protein SAMN05443639_10866 [Stigmatella erecta]